MTHLNPDHLFHAWLVMLAEDNMSYEVDKEKSCLMCAEKMAIKKDLFDKLSDDAKKVVMIIAFDSEGLNSRLSINVEYSIYIKKRLNGLRYRLQKNNPPDITKGTWHDIWYSLNTSERNKTIKKWEKEGIYIPEQFRKRKKIDADIATAFDSTCAYSYLKRFFKLLLNVSDLKINRVFSEIKIFVNEIYF
jgi:hypothetical protein